MVIFGMESLVAAGYYGFRTISGTFDIGIIDDNTVPQPWKVSAIWYPLDVTSLYSNVNSCICN